MLHKIAVKVQALAASLCSTSVEAGDLFEARPTGQRSDAPVNDVAVQCGASATLTQTPSASTEAHRRPVPLAAGTSIDDEVVPELGLLRRENALLQAQVKSLMSLRNVTSSRPVVVAAANSSESAPRQLQHSQQFARDSDQRVAGGLGVAAPPAVYASVELLPSLHSTAPHEHPHQRLAAAPPYTAPATPRFGTPQRPHDSNVPSVPIQRPEAAPRDPESWMTDVRRPNLAGSTFHLQQASSAVPRSRAPPNNSATERLRNERAKRNAAVDEAEAVRRIAHGLREVSSSRRSLSPESRVMLHDD
jgi:hypothetical protein